MTDDAYTSPIDGHAHFGVQARRECPVCTLELTAQSAMNVLRDFTERVATAAGVPLLWDEADQVGEPGTPKYNDRLIREVEDALAERDRLRAVAVRADGLLAAHYETDRWTPEHDHLAAALALDGTGVMGGKDELLTTTEAARILGVSRPHLIDKLLDTGVIPHFRTGRDRRIKRIDVEAYKRQRESSADVTKTGKVLTDADIEALADEAERGYDVEGDGTAFYGGRRWRLRAEGFRDDTEQVPIYSLVPDDESSAGDVYASTDPPLMPGDLARVAFYLRQLAHIAAPDDVHYWEVRRLADRCEDMQRWVNGETVGAVIRQKGEPPHG